MARNRKIPAPPPEGLIDVEQACRSLDISKPTLYRYMKAPDFPEPVKHLGKTWFKVGELEAWRAARLAGSLAASSQVAEQE